MRIHFTTEELKGFYETPLYSMRGKQKFSTEVLKQFKKRVDLLIEITKLEELRKFRGLNFEFLKGNRKGQCSLRLNDQYRLIITIIDEKTVQVILINEISKHYA
jgi:proteic killer suppression protein